MMSLILNSLRILILISFLLMGIFSCGGGGGGGNDTVNTARGTPIPNGFVSGCFLEDYPDPAASEYILPYQIGMSFLVRVGNCGITSTHRPVCTIRSSFCGDLRYAYDFFMPIGMILLASRGGEVVWVSVGGSSTGAVSNIIVIRHDDGTIARYIHLAQNGAFVTEGQIVMQGDPIGLSGQSGPTGRGGPTGDFPHLHFDVLEGEGPTCNRIIESGCRSIPIAFRNARPLDVPLIAGVFYEALPF